MTALAGKVALITGGASGIGEACARLFADQGASVVIVDVAAERGRLVSASIVDSGRTCMFVAADVSIEPELVAAFDVVEQEFGRLDVLVTSAAVLGEPSDIDRIASESFDRVMSVNVIGTFLALKYGIGLMKATGDGGSVVVMSSVDAVVACPWLAPYCASKSAELGLVRAAACDHGRDGVRVNAICPSGVRTPLLDSLLSANPGSIATMAAARPLGRLGAAVDVANAALFLACDASRYCSGAVLAVDGGLLSGVHDVPGAATSRDAGS